MTLLLKILLAGALLLIAVQDFRDRRVWAFLFPLYGAMGCFLFYTNTSPFYFWSSVALNLLVVAAVLVSVALYVKLVKKMGLLGAMGLGDVLFFLAMAISLPIFSFLNFFVFSILFTLALQLSLGWASGYGGPKVPLAGGMAAFVLAVYLLQWTGIYNGIYLM